MNLLNWISGGLDVFNGVLSYKNYKQQQKTYNYNQNLQQDIFKREDNSQVRAVQDLKNAGLSPVLAAGNGANAGQAINVTSPEMRAINMAATLSAMQSASEIAHTNADTDRLLHDLRVSQDLGIRSTDKNATAQISAISSIINDVLNGENGIGNTIAGAFSDLGKNIKDGFTGMFDNFKWPGHDRREEKRENSRKARDYHDKTVSQYGYTNPTDLKYIYK